MRTRLEHVLKAEPAVVEKPYPSRIIRPDTIRSVLSAWDCAASLEDPTDRERYRTFQSHLWRFWAVGPKGFRAKDMEYEPTGRLMLGHNPFGDYHKRSDTTSPLKSH